MKRLLLLMFTITLLSISCFSQEKRVDIYLGEKSLKLALKKGVTPLTEKEHDGYKFICENMTSPMLRVLDVMVDDSRRMIVTVKKIPHADYNFLSKYVFDCSEYIYKGLNSCICIDGDSLKEIDKETISAIQLGEYKK